MLKLYIGDVLYPGIKKSWIPTLDSVLSTQSLKNKYLYSTIIIFKKDTDYDYNFSFDADVVYTSSEIDLLTEHKGTDLTITIPGYYDYFDGKYYYCYICLYSNTFDLWDISNTLSEAYAIKYDQSSVTISSNYILNEWFITKNVNELIVSDNVDNVETLILPNLTTDATDISDYWLVNCKEFQLFDVINYKTSQVVETFNGLLYSLHQDRLMAVPKDYQLDKYNNLYISNLCTTILENSISNSSDYYLNKEINMIYGENVVELKEGCLYKLRVKIINFPKLEAIGDGVIRENEVLETINLPGTLVSMQQESINTTPSTLLYVNFGYDLGKDLKTPIYLQNISTLDATYLGVQFGNLFKYDDKGGNQIWLHAVIYDQLTPEQLLVAEDKNWEVIRN